MSQFHAFLPLRYSNRKRSMKGALHYKRFLYMYRYFSTLPYTPQQIYRSAYAYVRIVIIWTAMYCPTGMSNADTAR